ncbi:MAG: hypothetical protein OER88_05200, partial [Planctomycetota bacterium]|nr:hypothetical protein [Planctomycetota bacterium]
PLFDWKRQRELEAIVKDQREWVERQRKWRTEPLLKVLIPGAHAWLAAIDVDKKIANTKKGIQGVQRKVADGAYAVAVDLFGSMDRKAIEKQLAALQEQLANTSLSKQAREKANAKVDALKKGLKDITTLSGLDLIIRALDLTWWTKVLGAFVSLAKPQLRGRELELSQHEAHLGEYRRELNTVVQMHERHLLRLKRGLGYIP